MPLLPRGKIKTEAGDINLSLGNGLTFGFDLGPLRILLGLDGIKVSTSTKKIRKSAKPRKTKKKD